MSVASSSILEGILSGAKNSPANGGCGFADIDPIEDGLTRLVTFCNKPTKGKVIVRSAPILTYFESGEAKTYDRPLRDVSHLGSEKESS